MYFAYAILGALFEKERHGTGQRVDCSQLGAMITLQTLSITNQLIYGKQPDDGNYVRWRRFLDLSRFPSR